MLIVTSQVAEASCTWDAGFGIAKHNTLPSHGFNVGWDSVTADCPTFSVDHYRVVLQEALPFTGPSSYDWALDTTSLSAAFLIHRAERHVYAKLYACENAACTQWFGDTSGESTLDDTGNQVTDREKWLLVDVASRTDSSHYVVADDGTAATAPSAFFFPTGWTDAGKVALYYNLGDIYLTTTVSAGWDDYNDPSLWTTGVAVAGSHTSDSSYSALSHPFAFPVSDGSSDFVRLLVQNMPLTGTGYEHIVTVDSTDDGGDDFDLYRVSCCAGGASGECDWPTYGDVAVCADLTSTCDELGQASHGRWMWDLLADGPPDLSSDEPTILFSGNPDDSDCPYLGAGTGSQADIYSASWDASGAEWDVAVDSTPCPDAVEIDLHDPGVTPLPDDEFKMYVQEGQSTIHIYYYADGAWEDGSTTPLFLVDDGTGATTVTHDCVQNVDSLAYIDGTTPREGMFLEVEDDSESGCTDGLNQHAIYFARLVN